MMEAKANILPPIMFTLTYDDDKLPIENGEAVVSKKDVQNFFKRLRYYVPQSNFRYFICSEYGPLRHRPHYHGILYNFPIDKATNDFFSRVWSSGFVKVGIAYDGGFAYCAKYVTFKSKDYGKKPNFMLSSRRPAIGASYLERSDLLQWHRQDPVNNNYLLINGKKMAIPRYYSDKIYNDEQKQQLKEYWESHAQEERDKEFKQYLSDRPTAVDEQQARREYIAERTRNFYKSQNKSSDLWFNH